MTLKPLTLAEGFGRVVNFGYPLCRSATVDNFSGSWVHVVEAGASGFIAPYTQGVAVNMIAPSWTVTLAWEPPFGQSNPLPTNGRAQFALSSEPIAVTAGTHMFTPGQQPGTSLSITNAPRTTANAVLSDDGTHPLNVSGIGFFPDGGMASAGGSFSARLWVQPTSSASRQAMFVFGNPTTNHFFSFTLDGPTQITLILAGGGGPIFHSFAIPSPYDRRWHQGVVTYAAGTFTLYWDNVLIGTWAQASFIDLTGDAYLGQENDPGAGGIVNPAVALSMAEFDYTTYALSPAQIAASFNARDGAAYLNTVRLQNPIRFYMLNDLANPMADSSALSVNGTYSSGVTFGIAGP